MAAMFLAQAMAALSGCASSQSSAQSRYRDYALAVGQPYADEASVAQSRVNQYLAHLTPERRKALESYPYLAVEAVTIPAADSAALIKRLIYKGEVSGSGAQDPYNLATYQTRFIMIFDAKSGRPATAEGFVVMDTPRKGQPGSFGGYDALYIGNGK
jgi:hypothetical protein